MSSEPQSLQCLACHSAAALTRSNMTKTNPSQAPQGRNCHAEATGYCSTQCDADG